VLKTICFRSSQSVFKLLAALLSARILYLINDHFTSAKQFHHRFLSKSTCSSMSMRLRKTWSLHSQHVENLNRIDAVRNKRKLFKMKLFCRLLNHHLPTAFIYSSNFSLLVSFHLPYNGEVMFFIIKCIHLLNKQKLW